MLRAGLGGGWTQGSADQTARLYNLQPLSLDWNGAEGSPSISPPGGCSLPTGLLDLRFYLFGPSPPPSLCCLCFILTLLLEGVASTPSPIPVPLPGGIESTPEPGGWAWPCTDVSCILQEKGSKSKEGGAEALSFSLCLPPALPWCQIAITSSWNCSLASRVVSCPTLGILGMRGNQLLGGWLQRPGLRQEKHFFLRARPCPAQGHTWKPCTNTRDSASPTHTHTHTLPMF